MAPKKEEKKPEDIKPDKEGFVYYKCSNPKCDFIKKGNAKDITEEQFEQLKEALRQAKCPKCGRIGFVIITKAEYEKLEKAIQKKEEAEKVDPKIIKFKQDNIMQDIKRIQEELEEYLKQDKITAKGFASMMYHLIACEFKYYCKDKDLDLKVRAFRDLAKSNSEAILERYHITKNSEEEMYTLHHKIEENMDKKEQMESILYDKYEKQIAEAALLGNMEERDLELIQEEIRRIENEILVKEKYQQGLDDRAGHVQDRSLQIAKDSFLQELRNASK